MVPFGFSGGGGGVTCIDFHRLKIFVCYFSAAGFRGNRSLLEIFVFFPGVLSKWKFML